jgi:phosphoglycolate phosphatase-like HAD superfamily hydrolase
MGHEEGQPRSWEGGRRLKVLLFDIDGTLIRAGGAGRKALNRAALILYGKKNACSELSLAGRTDLWNFRAACEGALGRKATRREVERLHEEYLKHLPFYVRAAVRRDAYILPRGIKTLLKKLDRREDVLLGLGTGNMEKGARIKLEPSGFSGYFRFGGFGSDSVHRKVLLQKAVRRAAKLAGSPIDSNDVFVIGDTPLDVAAGKKAGYRTIGVGTGFATWYSLVEARPDFLARDFTGARKWLNWFKIKS